MNNLESILEAAACEVLGSMCFAALEYRGEGTIQNARSASIHFAGEVEGELKITLDSDLAKQLAADFLGNSIEEVTPEETKLFTLELANVLCGSALSGLAAGRHYQLGLPQSVDPDANPKYCFSVCGSEIDLGLSLQLTR